MRKLRWCVYTYSVRKAGITLLISTLHITRCSICFLHDCTYLNKIVHILKYFLMPLCHSFLSWTKTLYYHEQELPKLWFLNILSTIVDNLYSGPHHCAMVLTKISLSAYHVIIFRITDQDICALLRDYTR